MKIEFYHREDIDDAKWDSCIHRSINGLIYAYSWYLDEVCDEWDALVCDEYKAVMPLPRRRKWGFTYAYQPFFCQQLGVFSTTETSGDIINAFFRAIPKHFSFINIQVNVFTQPGLPGIVLKKRTNHRLPLIAVYDKLAATYNDNTKRNLKKAREAKLEAFENADPTSIIKLYTDNYAAKTPEVQAADYTRLKRLVNTAIKMGGLKAWGVYDAHNTLCAGALFLTDHKNVYYLLGGADDSGKEAGAMYALFDAFIERHAAHDLVLDFEGSDIEGIARFYRGFGAKTVNYYGLKQNLMPWWLKWLKK
jgi:hypothetical protein